MEIINKGKLIDQYKQIQKDFQNLKNKNPIIDDIEKIINKKNKTDDDYNIIDNKLKSSFGENKYIKIKEFLFFKKRFLHSYNKNRGTVLEYIFKSLFENNNVFELIERKDIKEKYKKFYESSSSINHMTIEENFYINNKRINIYSILQEQEVFSIKISCDINSIQKIISILYKYKLKYQKIEIENLEKEIFLKIHFKQKIKLSELIGFMKDTNIIYKKDLSTIIPDIIVRIKGTKKIFIIECKDREFTELEVDDLSKGIAYAQQYKLFSNLRIKESLVVLKGNESEDLENKKGIIEKVYQDSTKSNIRIVKAQDFIKEIKEKHNTNNFNMIKIRREEISKGKRKGKLNNNNNYSYVYDSNIADDKLIIDFDFEFNIIEKIIKRKLKKGDKVEIIKSDDILKSYCKENIELEGQEGKVKSIRRSEFNEEYLIEFDNTVTYNEENSLYFSISYLKKINDINDDDLLLNNSFKSQITKRGNEK